MTRDKLRPAACEGNGSLDNVKAVKRQVKQQSTMWNSGNLGSGDTAPDRQGWPPFGCNRATSRRPNLAPGLRLGDVVEQLVWPPAAAPSILPYQLRLVVWVGVTKREVLTYGQVFI